jgi:hypothetical protein
VKSPRFGGQILGVCLSGMIAFVPSAQIQSRAALTEPAAFVDFIAVGHLEAGHYRVAADLPAVLEVRMLIEQADANTDPPLERAELARLTLSESYGARLTEGPTQAHYMWVLINGEWVLVCTTVVEFQVDFGAWGHVFVETQDRMRVP